MDRRLKLLLSALPLIIGTVIAVLIVVIIVNAEGEVLDVTTVTLSFESEEAAQVAADRLETGETFADITTIRADAFIIPGVEPAPRRITPENSRLNAADIERVFSRDSLGNVYGPLEARREWVVLKVVDQNAVEFSKVYDLVYEQTLSTGENRAKVADFWMPIFLCSLGLVLTFNAGLWNIGVEGQVGMGAVGATGVALFIELSDQTLQLGAELLMAAAAGASWALLAAIMRTRGGVNEIFGGVALNFIASNFSAFLLVGPWKPETSTGSATERFPDYALLPGMENYQIAPVTLFISIAAFIFVVLTMLGSKWGLQLRAMGRNQRSAEVLGIPTERNIWLAMMICGALAGVAGAHLVLFRRGNLPANVSGGIGFLALLIVLLASIRVLLVPFISFVFALLFSSSLPLRTRLELDSSLIGVMVGVLVFFVMLFDGARMRIQEAMDRWQVGDG